MQVHVDPLLGRLTYERFFWEREEEIRLFGKNYRVRLRFRGDVGIPPGEPQRLAYAAFCAKRDDILHDAGHATYLYYESIVDEYREMLGESAEHLAPRIEGEEGLAALVTPTHLVIPRISRNEERIVGILCDCTWEPGLGLGIKFVNEVIVEVGTQDVLL